MRDGRIRRAGTEARLERRRLLRLVLGGTMMATVTSAVGRGPAVAAASGPGRRERRPTLDPLRFVGKARAAHEVARERPDLLDQLYCYCECDKSIGHKSLLSCYTDGHAAT